MVGSATSFLDAPDYVHHNDFGTAVLLGRLAAREFGGRLVLASSMVVYGEGGYDCVNHGPLSPPPRERGELAAGRFGVRCPRCGRPLEPRAITEAAPLDPRNVYAATKAHQEHLCFAFGRERGVPVTALRYHNVYGPRMPRDTPYAGVAAIFASSISAGRRPRVYEDGGQLRDFIMSATWLAPTCWRLQATSRATAPTTSPVEARAASWRWLVSSPSPQVPARRLRS